MLDALGRLSLLLIHQSAIQPTRNQNRFNVGLAFIINWSGMLEKDGNR
jgi:hypothetical protein